MKLLYKYLSEYKVKLGCCIAVLVMQTAFCLVMPFLMGNFINVGIQQKGIVERVPFVMTENAMVLFGKVLPDAEFEEFKNGYEFCSNSSSGLPEYIDEADNCYFIKNENNRLKEIYDNAVVSALIFAQDNFSQIDKLDINALYEYVSFNFIYEKLEDKYIEQDIAIKIYEDAEKTGDTVKNQISSMLLPFIYEDAGIDLESTSQNYIIKSALMMLLCGVGQILCMAYVHKSASVISAEIEKNLRKNILVHSAKFGKREFSKISPERITSAIITDVDQVGMVVNYFIKFFMYAPFVAIGGAVISLTQNLLMGIIIILTAVLITVSLYTVFRLTLKKYELMNENYNKLSKLFRTNIEQVLTIRSLNAENSESKKVRELSGKNNKLENFVLNSVFLALSLINLLTNVIIALIVIVGGDSLLHSSLSLGDMVAFIQYAILTVSAFLIVGASIVFAPKVFVAIKSIDEIMSTKVHIENKGTITEFNNDWTIEYKNVGIDESGNSAFTLQIPKGAKVAITGPTGCGKTTLMEFLLMRDVPAKGEILIGQEKIENFNISCLRKNITYVQSSSVLFTKTLRENLILHGCKKDDNIIEKALKIAQCDFLPENSLDRVIMNGGANFSGGQKSRLAIAGALGENSKIYIFDDCFTALDSKTEEKLLEALINEKKDATVIIVSQRIKSIMNCDKIIVLSDKGVEAEGTHGELINKSPYYKKAVDNQSKEVPHNAK